MKPYFFYKRNFIPFYLLSLYHYQNKHEIPRLKKFIIHLFVYGLATSSQFLRSLFLSSLCFLKLPSVQRITGNVWNLRFGYSNVTFSDICLKYITQVIPRIIRNPIDLNYSVNDWYFLNLDAFYSFEIAYFEFALYNLLSRANMGCHFFLIPKRKLSAFSERNYLRMLNIPIQYKLGTKII